MPLPAWLSRMLPFLYVVFGFAVAARLDSPLAIAAAMLLVLAAVLTGPRAAPGHAPQRPQPRRCACRRRCSSMKVATKK